VEGKGGLLNMAIDDRNQTWPCLFVGRKKYSTKNHKKNGREGSETESWRGKGNRWGEKHSVGGNRQGDVIQREHEPCEVYWNLCRKGGEGPRGAV